MRASKSPGNGKPLITIPPPRPNDRVYLRGGPEERHTLGDQNGPPRQVQRFIRLALLRSAHSRTCLGDVFAHLADGPAPAGVPNLLEDSGPAQRPQRAAGR